MRKRLPEKRGPASVDTSVDAAGGSACATLHAGDFPATAKGGSDKAVGGLVVGELHLGGIPQQFAFETHGDGAQDHPFAERPGVTEVGAGRIAAFAGADPVALMAR